MSLVEFIMNLLGFGGRGNNGLDARQRKVPTNERLRNAGSARFSDADECRYDGCCEHDGCCEDSSCCDDDYYCADDCMPDERYEEGSPSEEWYNYYDDEE